MIHACYVCRRITFAGMPTSDALPDPEPDDVSHGVCSECQPGETAKLVEWARREDERAIAEWADAQWKLADKARARRAAERLPALTGSVR